MNVLIVCEESQEVCMAYRAKGHRAFSCDLDECSGGHPEWHLQMDARQAIKLRRWDLIIMHPPCTKISVSGNRWYGHKMPKHSERLQAVTWTKQLWDLAVSVCDKVVMENPVGVLNRYTMLPTPQYIQPHYFGHPEFKKTGLWLHGVPKLMGTDYIEPPKKGTDEYKKWERIFRMTPSQERGRLRSKTYSGIAKAMAEQWG